MKAAIIMLADPKTGSEEALGRLFNGLAAVYDFKQKGHDVTLIFQGAATRWVGPLSDDSHPAYELYQAVKDKVAGVSCGCAEVFGATENAEACGMKLITDNPVPGTKGLPSLEKLVADGYTILTF